MTKRLVIKKTPPKKMIQARCLKFHHYRKKNFLKFYRKSGNIQYAARLAEIVGTLIYHWKSHDPEFAADMLVCEEEAVQRMEQEAHRRAITGINKGIYHNGELVDVVRQYSDTLLIFLLKARRPKMYRDNIRVTATTDPVVPIDEQSKTSNYDLSKLSPEERIQMRDLMLKVSAPDDVPIDIERVK